MNRIIPKDFKRCTYCCSVRYARLTLRVGGMPWPKTGATQYHAQLGLSDKGRAVKGLVVCYLLLLYDLWVGYLDKLKVRGLVPFCG